MATQPPRTVPTGIGQVGGVPDPVVQPIDMQGAAGSSVVLTARVTGDAFDRFRLGADGDMEWGDGATDTDVDLFRGGASLLQTGDELRSQRSSGSNSALSARTSGDTQNRWRARADGRLEWSDGTAAADVNLYRGVADYLVTDDSIGVRTATKLSSETLGVKNAAAGDTGIIVQGAVGQSSFLQRWNVSDGTSPMGIDSTGFLRWFGTGMGQTTVGAAGGASVLPLTPTRYLKVKDESGNTLVVPAYNP